MLKKFDEPGRLKEVNSYKLEDTLTEKEYDDIAFLASTICGTPIALVTLMYRDRQWFKAAVGTDLKENKRELSFCTHAIAGEEDVMMVENATEDVRFMHNPLVQGDPHLVFYAGAPIVNKNGYSIGTVCVYDVIKKSLTNEQIKGLKILSEQVMGLLELRKQNLRLENDIHQKVEVHKLIEASEAKFRHLILHAPVGILILHGPSYNVETVNEKTLEIWGKSYEEVINKPLFEITPEFAEERKKIFDDIYISGKPVNIIERKMQSIRQGKPEITYYNSIYQPLHNSDNKIYGLMLIATDVTEAVNARKRIEESEQRLRNILEQAPNHILILKGENMVLDTANEALYEIWRVDKSSIGKPLIEILPEVKGQGFLEMLQDVYFNDKVIKGYDTPAEFIRENGEKEIFYFNFVYQPYREVDGSISGVLITSSNVTQQVLAKKQIEASEQRLHNIIEQSPETILILKGENMVLDTANEALFEIWRTDKNSIGKPLLEILPEMKEQGFLEMLQDVYFNDKVIKGYESPVEFIRENGEKEIFYFNFIYQPYRELDGNISGVLVMTSNVTQHVLSKKQIEASEEEQKKLARDLKLATDSAGIGVWSLDLNTSKLEWSDIHKAMWGYDENREDLIYEDWHKLIIAEDKDRAFKIIEESKINREVYDVEYRINRANDGALLWIRSAGQYHYDEFGSAHTLTGISIDISQQKRIAEELSEAKSKAERSLQSKQQFLANMSHEIRTPMTAIVGFTNVLLKTDLAENQKQYLEAVKTSGDALIVLINDILDLAKVDAGKMEFANAPFKLSHSVNTIVHLFEPKIRESNLALVKEYDTRIPEILLGDSVRLHQILINLISNAIKFTSKGKITVSVNLLNEDKEKVLIEIKVTDTGIGIPENKFAAIFENFEQVSNLTSSLYGGTGLGLAIVKQLVEKQGGTVSVKSKVNEGSTFGFTLIFQKTLTEMESDNVKVNLNYESKNLKVLVVEDVKLNQLLMKTILDEYKFEWDIAENGKEAVEKLEINSYDIVLMDLQMPVMNGFEATEYIRTKMNLQIPIIALTADVTTVDLEKCKAVGMNDYISKPIDEKTLYNKILDLIKSK